MTSGAGARAQSATATAGPAQPGSLANLAGCGAPDQDSLGALGQVGSAWAGETVISGAVSAGGAPAGGAYVRLLDSGGEFTAEVVASHEGRFRFFARPGTWTVRALAPGRSGQAQVTAEAGKVTEVAVEVS
jgi:hypothetical protein